MEMVSAGRNRGARTPRGAREEEAGLDERDGRRDAGESATSEAISPERWSCSGGRRVVASQRRRSWRGYGGEFVWREIPRACAPLRRASSGFLHGH